ncbi:MAG: DUF3417 domain-containing protein [Acidimicrobiales bacterium]
MCRIAEDPARSGRYGRRHARAAELHRPTDLPEALAPLRELAMNLRWAWDRPTRDLFRWSRRLGRHPPRSRPGAGHRLARAPRRVSAPTRPSSATRERWPTTTGRYLDEPRWFQTRSEASSLTTVAYFSPRVRHRRALPQYSGGLEGILAGDHLKSASDLGVPLVGVGLFYRRGYRQGLSPDGFERFPGQDPWAIPLTRDGVRVQEAELAGTPLVAQVWRADVGRIPLYLLDADVEDNPVELRSVTDRLYGGDVDTGSARRSSSASAACGCSRRSGSTPRSSTNEESRLPRPRADAAGHRGPQAHLRRGGRGHPGRVDLHHPHAGAGRHRPLPPRP